jgi:hypothetical protein
MGLWRIWSFLLVLGVCAALLPPAAASGAGASASTRHRGQAYNALIVKHAANPVLRALRARLGRRLQVDRTSAPPSSKAAPGKLSRYDLLIVDGDNLSPRRMAHTRALSRFAVSGRWVLALDLRPAHFRRALYRHTGFRARGGAKRSRMFLFRRTTVEGSPQVQMIEARSLAPQAGARLSRRRRRRQAAQEAGRVAGLVQGALGNQVPGQSTAPGTSGIPPELQHISWSYTEPGHAKPPNGVWTEAYGKKHGIDVPSPGSQTASWTVNHNFDVYLDNSPTHPQGNFQFVSYEVNGEFTPKSEGEEFFQMYRQAQVFAAKRNLERAWWSGEVGVVLRPWSGGLVWQASQPATPDAETTYTSGNTFKVGFSASEKGGGISGSYAVSNEKSYSVPDWGVENQGSGNRLLWRFTSRKCDVREGHYSEGKCFNDCTGCDGTPLLPSDLSLGQVQVHASAWWKTKRLLPPTADLEFNTQVPLVLMDSYCGEWIVVCVDRTLTSRAFNLIGNTYTIAAGAVDPVPVESFSLAPNPVNGSANTPSFGTVKLKEAAPIDTSVVVYSDSGNAVVGPPIDGGPGSQRTITIPKGKSVGTFKILTNDNGLKRRGHTTADISAFYTKPTTKQLRVNAGKR